MIKILNLTLTPGTPAQFDAGLVDLPADTRGDIAQILYFQDFPELSEIKQRAEYIADIARDAGAATALLDGPAWMLSALEVALRERGITPLYGWGSRFVMPPLPTIASK